MRFTRDVLQKTRLPPLILALTILFSSAAPAQLFLQPKVIPTGNWPAAVYTADINGDGYPDLIYIDQGGLPASPPPRTSCSTTPTETLPRQPPSPPSATRSPSATRHFASRHRMGHDRKQLHRPGPHRRQTGGDAE
jgi:hypothetical protein